MRPQNVLYRRRTASTSRLHIYRWWPNFAYLHSIRHADNVQLRVLLFHRLVLETSRSKPSLYNPKDEVFVGFVTVFNRRISQDGTKKSGNSSLIDRPMSFVGHLKMPLWTKLHACPFFIQFLPILFPSQCMFVWHAVNGINLFFLCKTPDIVHLGRAEQKSRFRRGACTIKKKSFKFIVFCWSFSFMHANAGTSIFHKWHGNRIWNSNSDSFSYRLVHSFDKYFGR